MQDQHYSIYDLEVIPVKKQKKRKGKYMALLIAVLLVTGGAFGIGYQMSGNSNGFTSPLFYEASTTVGESVQPVGYDGTEKSIVEIVETVGPSIVGITSKVQYLSLIHI